MNDVNVEVARELLHLIEVWRHDGRKVLTLDIEQVEEAVVPALKFALDPLGALSTGGEMGATP